MIRIVRVAHQRLEKYSPELARAGRFLLVGAAGLALNLTLLYALTEGLRLPYFVSAIFAFLCSYSVSFVLQKFLTFRDHVLERAPVQYLLFISVAAVNVCINVSILVLLVEGLALHYILAQIVASIIVGFESFVVYRRMIFTHERTNTP
jgi:dolichol-phosphate mannosyltransferase